MISANGNKAGLRMQYPMSLCPMRSATPAGQNTIAIEMRRDDAQAKPDDVVPSRSGRSVVAGLAVMLSVKRAQRLSSSRPA